MKRWMKRIRETLEKRETVRSVMNSWKKQLDPKNMRYYSLYFAVMGLLIFLMPTILSAKAWIFSGSETGSGELLLDSVVVFISGSLGYFVLHPTLHTLFGGLFFAAFTYFALIGFGIIKQR